MNITGERKIYEDRTAMEISYKEEFESLAQARKRENSIKKIKNRKFIEALINPVE